MHRLREIMADLDDFFAKKDKKKKTKKGFSKANTDVLAKNLEISEKKEQQAEEKANDASRNLRIKESQPETANDVVSINNIVRNFKGQSVPGNFNLTSISFEFCRMTQMNGWYTRIENWIIPT